MLEVTGGDKEEVSDTQGQCSPAENMDAGWVITREIGELGDMWRREKIWSMMVPDPDSLPSGWKIGLRERLGNCWEQQA